MQGPQIKMSSSKIVGPAIAERGEPGERGQLNNDSNQC